MSEFDKLLQPEQPIPWDKAADFYMVVKEAAGPPQTFQEAARREHVRGGLSGIRRAAHERVTHAGRLHRTRGERVGKGVGTAAGVGAGLLATRGMPAGAKAVGAAAGGVLGRILGQEAGREADIQRVKTKPKKAEMIKKSSVARVRELWKLAQDGGDPDDYAASEPSEAAVINASKQAKPPRQPKSKWKPTDTPEMLERSRADAQIQQEAVEHAAASENAAEYYRQMAEDTGAQLEEMSAQVQQGQMAADQAGQAAQAAQVQADQAQQMSQMQSQQLAASQQEAMASREHLMQLQQAMQDYRQNLQQLALQDPAAQVEQTQMAQQMEAQGMQPEAMGQQEPGMPPEAGVPPEAAAAQGAPPEAMGMSPEAVPELLAGPEAPQASKKPKPKDKKEKTKEKTISVKEKTSSFKARAIGAGIGALAGAGAGAIENAMGGPEQVEKAHQARARLLEQKPDKGALGKYKQLFHRNMADFAKIHKEHPRVAIMAASAMGAGVGASLAPSAARLGRSALGKLGR